MKSANSQADTNAAKTIALDHLGVIAARIRSSALKVQIDGGEAGPKFKGLKPLEEVRYFIARSMSVLIPSDARS